MIKRLIRGIASYIYRIGEFEAEKKRVQEKKEEYNSRATIDGTTILDKAIIFNNQNNRDKIVIGSNCVIKGELLVFKHGGEITIGDYCFIGEGSRIWSSKKIVIGNRVLVSHNVNIHDNISHPLDPQLRHEDIVHIFSKGLQESITIREAEIIIGDDAWIGFNATILKGIKIGKGAIIGAGAIVTKDVPDFAVVVGPSARIIRDAQE